MKQTPPADAGTQSYAMYLFAGMLPWLLFSDTVIRASSSIVEQSNLITKTMFPSEIVPVSIFLSSAISHLLTVVLFLVIAGIREGHFRATLAFLPMVVVLVGVLSVGIGWIAASLQVYLRDTAQVVAVLMTLWMWITPIMITESQIPEGFRSLLVLNPLVFVVRAYRHMLLGSPMPSFGTLGLSVSFAVVAFVCGGLFFRHMKRGFADVL